MIPPVLSDQIRRGLENYLKTTFQITNPHFNSLLENYLNLEDEQLIKGPYLTLHLPFVKEPMEESPFGQIEFPHATPFRHQKKAFERLAGEHPKPTLIATGTGSGKTEAFLFPILDYCAAHLNEKGVKAILVYPMNALANDQAERIARYIYDNEQLRGNVRAGLYVGRGRVHEVVDQPTMTANQVINSHHRLQEDPPDILLTNYKMLDYMLIRPQDSGIWQHNEPDTLRYLVVDELHTFDGAQGTDLACLLRRLRSRLKSPENYICPVGTSATLGGKENFERLLTYARQVFGRTFDEDAVITEQRMKPDQFFSGLAVDDVSIPEPDREDLEPDLFVSTEEFIRKQVDLWTQGAVKITQYDDPEWRLTLGDWLMKHQLLRQLFELTRGKPTQVYSLVDELSRMFTQFEGLSVTERILLLNSYLVLISEARLSESGGTVQLLDMNIQVWLREMRRMVASVDANPELRSANDLTEDQLEKHLPILVCRDCGQTGWGGTYKKIERRVNHDLDNFYQSFFNDRPDSVFLFPLQDDEDSDSVRHRNLCTNCMHVHQLKDQHCSSCLTDKYFLRVHKYQNVKVGDQVDTIIKDCPRCGSNNSLTIIGARSATLSAVSVSQFFASPYSGNREDKRLLAFSDSVQDASHRSGFFTGRTYQFNFRGALQQYLDDTGWNGTLAELPAAFIQYYQKKMSSPEAFIAQFIHPGMQWLHDYEMLIENNQLPSDSNLMQLVNNRIGWEIFSEYGHRALIGRTLEKSGSSMVAIDGQRLQNAVDAIAERLKAHIGSLRQVENTTVTQLILGILYNLRTRGGIFHYALNQYIERWGDNRAVNYGGYRLFMPFWGRKTRTPSFLTNKSDISRFQTVLASNKVTWHQRWAEKVLRADAELLESYMEQIFDILLKQMVQNKLLQAHKIGRHTVWSMPSDALVLTNDIEHLVCNHCGHRIQSPVSETGYWQNSSCIQFNCRGRYEESVAIDHYYKRLYSDGHIKRIRAAEHTGLLDREMREQVEAKFKSQDYPWFPNLLSSTPTLEMGIDIGDLNSVFLCSVPPNQASYIQRIGRAGRKTGSAFNLTVSESSPHDLYFFSNPLYMIDGEIDTPGCFLNAVAVLKRQFFAFVLDRYVEHYGQNANILTKLGQSLRAFKKEDHETFPHKFIDFFHRHQDHNFDDFVQLFQEDMTEDTQNRLKEYIEGSEAVREDLMAEFQSLLNYKQNELDNFRNQRKQINNTIRFKEQNPVQREDHEETIKKLQQEASALTKFIKSIERENIFQTLTNEGLIPNYTFPESGIKLKSVIYKKVDDEFQTEEYEYIRPASTGLRDFAPDNTFYAEGRKVTIDKVNLQLSELQTWRFCPSCHHTERVPEAKEEVQPDCPLCNDIRWSDAAQEHDVVELRQVEATTSNRDSYSWDENEERDPKFYEKNILVQIEEARQNIHSAFKLDTDRVPFAFEFLKKIRLLDINFGETLTSNETSKIAGRDVPAKGFEVCERCGRVAKSNGKIEHTRSCQNYDDQDAPKNYFYLYRELHSEALRILLPSTAYELDSADHHSFNAAFYLGLREYFGGNIDHLQTTYMQEKPSDGKFHSHYLVLYDTIPGGTGYLKQLMENTEQLRDVFEVALKKLRTCKCRTEEKPGCYECIYAYRHSYKMSNINSPLAIEILNQIINRWDTISPVKTVDIVKTNRHLQSQLEEKFIKHLDKSSLQGKRSYLLKEPIHGKDGWRWIWGDRVFRIEPQVSLSKYVDISHETVADFVIWPFEIEDKDQTLAKPIAIFTDGFEYHRDNLDEDFEKRCSIINNADFLVWNITWDDLVEEDAISKGIMEIDKNQFSGLIQQYAAPEKIQELLSGAELWNEGNGLDTLLAFIENPDEIFWKSLLLYLSFAFPGNGSLIEKDDYINSMNKLIEEENFKHPAWNGSFQGTEGTEFLKSFYYSEPASQGRFGYLFTIPKDNLTNSNIAFENSRGVLKFWDDNSVVAAEQFRDVWASLLHHLNLLQFLDQIHVITTRGIQNHRYSDWVTMSSVADGLSELTNIAPDFDLLADELQPFTQKVDPDILAGAVVGYELTGEHDQILAESELAWPALRIGILGEWQMEQREAFDTNNWQIYTITEAVENPESVIDNIIEARESTNVSS